MDRNNENVFLKDIEVPTIVEEKAEAAFLAIHKEGMDHMNNGKKGKNVRKLIMVAAACAAVVVLGAIAANQFSNRNFMDDGAGVAAFMNSSETAQEDVQGSTNPFVLIVHAAESGEDKELKEGVPVVISAQTDSYVLSGQENGNGAYCINLPISCEGENIDSITYSINKGAFQIVENENDSIVISGTELQEGMDVGLIGVGYDEETGQAGFPVSIKYYTEYTVEYNRQSSDTTWINIGRDDVALSSMDLIWGEDSTVQDRQKGYQELIDGVVITCTINFSDGTHDTAQLVAGTLLATPRDAGIDGAVYPDEEDVFFTFERQ